MARSRQLKPDFFADEDLSTRSHAARLLFQGLWTLADREGRLEDRPLKIKAALFPYEAVDVEALLAELARPKQYAPGMFIVRYEVEGRKYIQVCNFTRHQNCHPREQPSTLPAPPGKGTAGREKAMPGPAVPSSSTSDPSVPSDVRVPAAAPRSDLPGMVNRRNPHIAEGGRAVWETECLRRVREIAEAEGLDGAEVLAQAAGYPGDNGRIKTNPASMTEDRLVATVLSLRKRAQGPRRDPCAGGCGRPAVPPRDTCDPCWDHMLATVKRQGEARA